MHRGYRRTPGFSRHVVAHVQGREHLGGDVVARQSWLKKMDVIGIANATRIACRPLWERVFILIALLEMTRIQLVCAAH